jgi:hypothetical protein
MDRGVSKPKPPEIAGGRPLPLFPAMVGKTWYQGGGSIIVFVPGDEREQFEALAALAGYVVEDATWYTVSTIPRATVKLTLAKASPGGA